MPPKDIQPTGTLMISTDGGETMMPLGHISEALIVDDLIPEDQTHPSFTELKEGIMFSCKFRMDNSASILLATGKWPSNNWLKMHGIPMERNAWKKRQKNYAKTVS